MPPTIPPPRTPAERFGHRLRNAASVVLVNVEWLKMVVTDDKQRESLADIEAAAAELRDLCAKVEIAVAGLTLPDDGK
jgi:hypothetical protein